MDSHPQSADPPDPISGRRASGNSGAPTLWGLFIFAAMFVGQIAVIA